MNDTAPKRIFISYSRKDGAGFAATLRKDLEAEHFSVWQDLIALEGGRDWWTQIEEALRSKALQHFVLVVTPGSLASKAVRDEIRLARQEGKTVSPVKGPGLDDLNKLPRWLGQVYDRDLLEHRNTLMRVLAGPSNATRVPMMAPEPPADFVQRPAEFSALKAKLLNAGGDAVAITAALRGAGGYGKTTLASARPRPGHRRRLFRRHPLGGTWREARKSALHPLRPDRDHDRRAPRPRKPERRRRQARRGARRSPHPAHYRRRLARAGFAPLQPRRAQHHAARDHAARRYFAAKRCAPASGCHAGRRGADAARLGPAGGSGGGAEQSARSAGGPARRMGAAPKARQRLPARPGGEEPGSRLIKPSLA